MLAKTRPNSLILSLLVPRLDPTDPRLLRKRARLDVRPDARLVVAEQVRIFLVKHAVDLKDVGISSGSLELVAGTIEAEDQGFLRYEDFAAVLMLMTRLLGRGFVVVAVIAAFPLRTVMALSSALGGMLRSIHSRTRVRAPSRVSGVGAID